MGRIREKTFLLKKIRLKPGLATHTFEKGVTCISDVGKNVSSLILSLSPPLHMPKGCLTSSSACLYI